MAFTSLIKDLINCGAQIEHEWIGNSRYCTLLKYYNQYFVMLEYLKFDIVDYLGKSAIRLL